MFPLYPLPGFHIFFTSLNHRDTTLRYQEERSQTNAVLGPHRPADDAGNGLSGGIVKWRNQRDGIEGEPWAPLERGVLHVMAQGGPNDEHENPNQLPLYPN